MPRQAFGATRSVPGGTATNIAETMPADRLDPGGAQRAGEYAALIPAFLKPEDIANLALFLASDESCHINGAIIPADAGWTEDRLALEGDDSIPAAQEREQVVGVVGERRLLALLRAEGRVGRQHLLDRRHRQRTREEKALRVSAAEALQLARLHLALDSFRDDAGLHRPSERQDAFDDRRTIGEKKALDEGPIDLERVDRQLVQMAQR